MYDKPDLDSDRARSRAEERSRRDRRGALEVLLEARERLVAQMCGDILSSRDVILDDSPDGLFSFELQEIEDRYSARLHALNSILENLEYRRPRIAHRIETFRSTRTSLQEHLDDAVNRFDQWDLVDIDVTPLEGEEVLVVVAFTADEYVD